MIFSNKFSVDTEGEERKREGRREEGREHERVSVCPH